ncbi:3-dehydrosphinganine reductase, variant 2, partial [Bonamia ostreae]
MALPGYSDYTPSKWALRALCDTLQMEFQSSNISFHIFYPPNMDTPGFTEEQKRSIKVVSAEKAAKECLEKMEKGVYAIKMDFLTSILYRKNSVAFPRRDLGEWLLDLVLVSMSFLVETFIYVYCHFVFAFW